MSCGTKKVSYKICRCACKWNCNCLIPQEKKSFPAFGSSAKRDVRIGLHPKMYKGSTIDSPAVGLYNPKFPFKCKRPSIRYTYISKYPFNRSKNLLPPICIQKRLFLLRLKFSWKRQIETKEFSLTMGGRYEGKLKEQREQLKVGRGPGTHEILQWPDDVLQKPCKTTKRNVGFGGIVPLFQPSWPSVTPGPGEWFNKLSSSTWRSFHQFLVTLFLFSVSGYSKYYPYYYIDKREREGASCVPTFEYDGLYPRSTIEVKPWSLPCILYVINSNFLLSSYFLCSIKQRWSLIFFLILADRYKVKDARTLDAFLKKVVGKRGPYDLFTGWLGWIPTSDTLHLRFVSFFFSGPRDDTTIKNYFAKSKKFDNWPISIPCEMDKLKKKSNYYKGRWSTCPRYYSSYIVNC